MACQAPGLLRRLSAVALLLALFQPVLTSVPSLSPPCDQQEGSGCGDMELDGDEEYSGSDLPPQDQDQGQDHHIHDPSGHPGSTAATLATSSPWCFVVGVSAAWATAYVSSAW